jgi:hypothetical protein
MHCRHSTRLRKYRRGNTAASQHQGGKLNMSASTFKPTTNMSTREIAVPSVPGLMPNHPQVEGVKTYRQNPGSANSNNEAGGYVGPESFKDTQPKG